MNTSINTDQKSGYKKILVAVDDSDPTSPIFNQALHLAQINGAELMVFHAVPGGMPGVPEIVAYSGMGAYSSIYTREMVEYEEKAIKEATEELLAWLNTFVRQAQQKGVNATCDYLIGEAGLGITDMAKSWGADLIVVGRRGRRGLSELLLGSVSNYVIHHAACSVLVVQ